MITHLYTYVNKIHQNNLDTLKEVVKRLEMIPNIHSISFTVTSLVDDGELILEIDDDIVHVTTIDSQATAYSTETLQEYEYEDGDKILDDYEIKVIEGIVDLVKPLYIDNPDEEIIISR